MAFSLKSSAMGFLCSLLLSCGKKEEAAKPAPVPPEVTSLTLESLTPAAGAIVSRTSTLTAQLKYSLADGETSSDGYRVAILFASTTSNSTFSVGSNNVTLPNRKGTLTLQYPLSLIWDRTNPAPAHPITCYYYLQRVSGNTSTVIAQTPAQTFTE
ncbi:hypothetical protein ACFST9_13325 [Hymenobacter monticola]|uniref:Fimbrillin family protein n=1 Tax=Hymenobacter monticola TaxID=1705399 RepID=A0ABY4B6Y0_9BACT|nr:hypothetical protein [Hymenobacter monticola]UOE34927.1 hypothetical protein MTP16_04555 [Hymenobacter monticola]